MSETPSISESDTPVSNGLAGSMRAVIPYPHGGRVLMAGFPGLEIGIDGAAVFVPEACRQTLDGLHAHGATQLVVLVERDELAATGFDLLEATAAEVGLGLLYRPIVDYSVPPPAMAQAWSAERAARDTILRAGGALAFCCQYGAGRSGLMAAWTLMEGGLSAEAAIKAVRAQFSDAVESAEQEAWLANLTVLPA